MSDAREWLTEVQDQNGGDESPCGVLVRVETAALLAVLDLHQPTGILGIYCSHCAPYGDVVYPCPTVEAVNKVLGIDDE